MKVVTLIPYWKNYNTQVNLQSEITKEFKHISGRHLLNYVLEASNKVVGIDENIIYASNYNITNEINPKLNYTFVPRPEILDTPETKIKDIISTFFIQVDADIVVLIHPKCPFLTSLTIQDCLDKVVSKAFDSAIVGESMRQFAWYQGKPLNYKQEDIPHLINIEPVFIEKSALYVFSKKSFDETGSRIGRNPYFKHVSKFEGLVILNQSDFEMAEVVVNSGIYQ